MIIADELYLLLTKDDGKPEQAYAQNEYGLAAAVLTDLIAQQRIVLDGPAKKAKVRVVSDAPTGHPALDAALARVQDKEGKSFKSYLTDGKVAQEEAIAQSLVDQGVLEWGEKGFLGMGKRRTPVRNPAPEQQIRRRLAAVLAGAAQPTIVDASVLAILQGMDVAHKVLSDEAGGLSKKELKARIQQIAENLPAGDAVAAAIQDLNVIMLTAVIIPVVVTGGSS